MAISFVGSSTGINSATLPAHQAGDIIIAFAFRDGSTAYPTVPAGWTPYYYGVGTTCSCSTAILTATNSSTVSGTWTNATSVIFHVYRGVSFANNASGTSGTTTTVTYPAVSIYNAKSWVVAFVGSRSTNVVIESAPSGMVNRSSVSDATDEAAGHDTNSQVSSFTQKTVNIGGTASGWVTSIVELADIRQDATTTITGIQATSSLDNFSFINTNWWQFFFEQGLPLDGFVTSDWHAFFFERGIYLEALGQANKQLSGFETSSAFASISAIGQTNATASITSIQAVSYFADLIATVSDSEIVNGIEAIAYISEISISATANNLLTGLSVNSDFSELLFQASSNLTFDGIEISTTAGVVAIKISDSEIVNGIEAVALYGQTTASADSYFEQSGLSSQTDIEEISALADANIAINGNELDALFDAVSVTADSVSFVSGNQATAESGEVTASTIIRINATAGTTGISANASFGNVSAISESPETWSSGQVMRYPANQFVSATAKTGFVTAKSEIGEVQTDATTIINTTISLNNVVSFTQASDINASGTLEISDEELILLLAA